jgi:hypothetical protein
VAFKRAVFNPASYLIGLPLLCFLSFPTLYPLLSALIVLCSFPWWDVLPLITLSLQSRVKLMDHLVIHHETVSPLTSVGSSVRMQNTLAGEIPLFYVCIQALHTHTACATSLAVSCWCTTMGVSAAPSLQESVIFTDSQFCMMVCVSLHLPSTSCDTLMEFFLNTECDHCPYIHTPLTYYFVVHSSAQCEHMH